MLRKAGSRQAVEEASVTRRQAVAALTDAAMAELDNGSLQTRDRITRTLLAVATDSEGEAISPPGHWCGSWSRLEAVGVRWSCRRCRISTEQEARAVDEARERAGKFEIEAIDAEAQVETAKQALAEAKRRARQADRPRTRLPRTLGRGRKKTSAEGWGTSLVDIHRRSILHIRVGHAGIEKDLEFALEVVTEGRKGLRRVGEEFSLEAADAGVARDKIHTIRVA